MGKIIRPTYPREFSIGLLILIFAIAFFLSGQIFEIPKSQAGDQNQFIGMFLIAIAVVIIALILWEEFLFPIKINLKKGEITFRNHRTKLKIQAFAYLAIPFIFAVIYFNFEVNTIRFYIWSALCIVIPVAGKLISGINNYNDFLKFTDHTIAYKNNTKAGTYLINTLTEINLIKDQRNVLHKIELIFAQEENVTIDLDEMELEAYYESIDKYLHEHYSSLLR